MFFDTLFDVFEASWGAFWASWGSLGSLLGRSWAILGRNWGGFGPLLGHFDFYYFFGVILGAKKVPKGRHFGRQNGAKIDPKSRCKFKSEIVTSWSRLGSKLARFSFRLRVKNVDFSLVFIVFLGLSCILSFGS